MIIIIIYGREIVCKIEDFVWIALMVEHSADVEEFEVWQSGFGRLTQKQAGCCGFQKWLD